MHIKKLEISGFKSFVDRTVIHFDHDVIGIVGPNGCGKSNIVDALRWCMGEQSAKHLRGRAMEDVIFSGSESRSPNGMAEVSITFDNRDSEYASSLPEAYRDYAEIAVTRRLYRDGTSEYLINKTQVRLRDITELFLGTGVGTKAYSIVEQGRIGQIVSARPQDRRLFLEEAAGVTKYKQRRKQAERKLDLTKQNLLRVNDIVSEIDRNRGMLKRQAAKAERFIKHREELEELVLHEASHRLLELLVVSRMEGGQQIDFTERADGLRAGVNQRENELTQARQEASVVEARADRASKDAYDADNTVASLQAEFERGRDRMAHLDERLRSAARQREELVLRQERLRDEEEGLAQRSEQLNSEVSGAAAAAERENEALRQLMAEERAAFDHVQKLRKQHGDLRSRIAGNQVRVQAIRERREGNQRRFEALGQQDSELREKLAGLSARKVELDEHATQAREQKTQTASVESSVKVELDQKAKDLSRLEGEHKQARREFEKCRGRVSALEELEQRLEGVKSGAKAVLSSGKPGLHGLFVDRLEVPPELTDAIAGLLGERLEAVIASDGADLLPVFASLQSGKQGRVSILSTTPRFIAGASATPGPIPGTLGRAADLVRYDAADEPLVRLVLGDAVVVEHAADALTLSRQYGIVAAALDGTVADPCGVLTGGSIAAPRIDRKREIAELRIELAERSARLQEVEAAEQELTALVASLRQQLESARKATQQAALSALAADKDQNQLTSEINGCERQLGNLVNERDNLEQGLARADSDEQQCQAALAEETERAQGLGAELEQAEEAAGACKERLAAHSVRVTDQKVKLAQLTEQRDSIAASQKRTAETRRATDAQALELEQTAQEAATQYGEIAAKLLKWREDRAVAEQMAASCHRELTAVRSALEGIRNSLGVAEEDLRTLRAELTLVDGQLRECEMRLQKLELEKDHLLAGIRERFRGLELGRVVGTYHARPAPDAEHRRRIDELGKVIDRMGPVNLDAQVEYEQAEKRFTELSQQKNDIEQAMNDLEQAIKHMDRESRRRFKETFTAVNELFSQMFKRMFKGGNAELKLTEPDDVLESGVEIVAQPPGKKLGTVELMSGGEKALTAASLIFAIFQHRPSPFCVLDEVDAPLDEANVERYNEAIRSMTHKSQFILITHIKKTMQSVDLLYGVTMGEPGVSRVVSVKVNEHALPRKETVPRPPRSVMPPEPMANTQVA
jgi:chromosome segregation protein